MNSEEYEKLLQNVNKNKSVNLFGETKLQERANTDNSRLNISIYNRLIELVNLNIAVFVPHNVPALKNSKVIKTIYTGKSACCKAPYIKLGNRQYRCTKCNNLTQLGSRPIITKSKAVEKYYDESSRSLLFFQKEFIKMTSKIDKPYHLGFYFIRGTLHDFDLDNAMTTVLDQLKALGFINDDNSKEIYPYPLGEHYEKNKGGLIIALIEKPHFKFINDESLPYE